MLLLVLPIVLVISWFTPAFAVVLLFLVAVVKDSVETVTLIVNSSLLILASFSLIIVSLFVAALALSLRTFLQLAPDVTELLEVIVVECLVLIDLLII